MDLNIKLENELSKDIFSRCQSMAEDIEALFNVRLTFRDHTGTIRSPEGKAFISNRDVHTHPYCLIGRQKGNAYDKRCVNHCLHAITRRCKQEKNPFLSHCWKDNYEIVVPVLRGDQLLLTIFASGYRDKESQPILNTKVESEQVASIYTQLNPLTLETSARIIRVLKNLGLGLLKEVEEFYEVDEMQNDRKSIIKRFIHFNAHSDIHLDDLAKVLFLSSSRAGHLVKEIFKKPFQDLLMQERIDRAKNLLTSTGYKQDMIASQCGFNNEFYFNRAFTKMVGLPPGKYRKRNKPLL